MISRALPFYPVRQYPVYYLSADLNANERHPGLDGEDAGYEHVVKPEEVGGLGGLAGGHKLPDGGHSQDVGQTSTKRGEIVSLRRIMVHSAASERIYLVIFESHSVFPLSFHNRVVPYMALNQG